MGDFSHFRSLLVKIVGFANSCLADVTDLPTSGDGGRRVRPIDFSCDGSISAFPRRAPHVAKAQEEESAKIGSNGRKSG